MAKTVNKTKIKMVKQGILKGKSAKQAMIDAGYKETTAGHTVSPYNTLLKLVHDEIEKDFKMTDVTPEQVLREIDTLRALALEVNDLSTAGRMSELKGRYLAMFTDKKVIDAKVITNEDQAIIDQYIPSNTGGRVGNLLHTTDDAGAH